MKYQGIFIADLHIGAMPRVKLQKELETILYPYLETMDLDFVIFCGDYFDHKLYLNEENVKLASEVLDTVDKLLKPEAKIRMLYGTKSHEEDQYDSFETLSRRRDFKVIRYASEEELFPGMHVLYLPEEILTDSESYYHNFFEKEDAYELVIGHGVIKEGMKTAARALEEKKTIKRKVPIFKVGQFQKICNGITVFGHYHVHDVLDPTPHKEIQYVGSFSRWKFGEEEDKGFLYGCFDSDKKPGKQWKTRFEVNPEAEVYKTIGFGFQNTIFQSIDDMKEKMDHYEKLTKNGTFDHLKIAFNIPETCENSEYYMEYLKERFKNEKSIKVDITNGYIEKKRSDAKKEIEEDYEKYAPVFDPNQSLEDQVSYFIEVEYNRHLNPDTVSLYLYNDLNDILATTPEEKEEE